MKVAVVSALALGSVVTACGADLNRSSATSGGVSASRSSAPVHAWLPALLLPKVMANSQSDGTDLRCHPALDAEIAIEGAVLRGVVLSDVVLGPSEVMITPNKRFYELHPARDDCGTKVYL